VPSISQTNSYIYDANGNRTHQTAVRRVGTNVLETTTTYIYDGQNRLSHMIEPDGKTNSVVYDENGSQKRSVDKLGHVTEHEYDERGHLRRTIHPDQSADQSGYDAEGRRTFATNRLGHVNHYVYDAMGRLTQTIFPDNTTSITAYDSAGRVSHTVDSRGMTNTFGYDNAGRRTSVTNAWGTSLQQVITYAYDVAGSLTNTVDAAGLPTGYFYDDLYRRTNIVYADGSRELTRYDALSRKIAETDRATNTTSFAYDAAGRLTYVTNALGHVTSYGYDEVGNPNAIDADGWTPLLWAVWAPSLSGRKCRGRRIRPIGATPATYPKLSVQEAMVRLLIKHGADLNHVAKKGETALTLASSPSLVRLMKKAGANPTTGSGGVSLHHYRHLNRTRQP
jgi:YD repeat-containing protein